MEPVKARGFLRFPDRGRQSLDAGVVTGGAIGMACSDSADGRCLTSNSLEMNNLAIFY